jgi:hypothetical protein
MATNIVRQEQNSERFTSGSREDGRQAQPKHYDGKTQSGLNGRELLAQGLGWSWLDRSGSAREHC